MSAADVVAILTSLATLVPAITALVHSIRTRRIAVNGQNSMQAAATSTTRPDQVNGRPY